MKFNYIQILSYAKAGFLGMRHKKSTFLGREKTLMYVVNEFL